MLTGVQIATFVWALAVASTAQAEKPVSSPTPVSGVSEGPRPPAPAVKPKRRVKPGLSPATLSPTSMPQASNHADELGLRRRRDGSYLYVDPGARFTAEFRNDGTILFADRWRRPDPKNPEHGGGFALPPGGFGTSMNVTGPTEWLMHLTDDDPNRRAKAELLKRTRALRTQLAVNYHLALIETRFSELHGQLRGVLENREQTVEQRRELLFQLWDDCDESFAFDRGDIPPEAITIIDDARVETAEKARRAIELFIRKKLPKTSRRAYSKPELADMNRRRVSTQPFAPYTRRRSPSPAKRPPQPQPATAPPTP